MSGEGRERAGKGASSLGAPSLGASSLRASSRPPPPPLDPEALLCALVLSPDTWSRNRFFRVFEDAKARRARRRAALVRSVVATLRERGGNPVEVLPACDDDAGDVEIAFHVPTLGLTRRTRVAQLELALIRYALGCGSDEERLLDRDRVEQALGRLAPGRVAPGSG